MKLKHAFGLGLYTFAMVALGFVIAPRLEAQGVLQTNNELINSTQAANFFSPQFPALNNGGGSMGNIPDQIGSRGYLVVGTGEFQRYSLVLTFDSPTPTASFTVEHAAICNNERTWPYDVNGSGSVTGADTSFTGVDNPDNGSNPSTAFVFGSRFDPIVNDATNFQVDRVGRDCGNLNRRYTVTNMQQLSNGRYAGFFYAGLSTSGGGSQQNSFRLIADDPAVNVGYVSEVVNRLLDNPVNIPLLNFVGFTGEVGINIANTDLPRYATTNFSVPMSVACNATTNNFSTRVGFYDIDDPSGAVNGDGGVGGFWQGTGNFPTARFTVYQKPKNSGSWTVLSSQALNGPDSGRGEEMIVNVGPFQQGYQYIFSVENIYRANAVQFSIKDRANLSTSDFEEDCSPIDNVACSVPGGILTVNKGATFELPVSVSGPSGFSIPAGNNGLNFGLATNGNPSTWNAVGDPSPPPDRQDLFTAQNSGSGQTISGLTYYEEASGGFTYRRYYLNSSSDTNLRMRIRAPLPLQQAAASQDYSLVVRMLDRSGGRWLPNTCNVVVRVINPPANVSCSVQIINARNAGMPLQPGDLVRYVVSVTNLSALSTANDDSQVVTFRADVSGAPPALATPVRVDYSSTLAGDVLPAGATNTVYFPNSSGGYLVPANQTIGPFGAQCDVPAHVSSNDPGDKDGDGSDNDVDPDDDNDGIPDDSDPDDDGDGIPDGSEGDGSASGDVRVLPYVKAYGNDLRVGAGFGASCNQDLNGAVRAYFGRNTANQSAGSGNSLAVIALDVIQGYQPSNIRLLGSQLAYANDPSDVNMTAAQPVFGGFYGSSPCNMDYYAMLRQDAVPLVGTNFLNNDGQFTSGPGLTNLTNGSPRYIPAGVQSAVFATGDVYIDRNFQYDLTAPWASLADMQQFTLVVRGGNIYIGPEVDELNGMFIAQPDSSGNGGNIYTCSRGASALNPSVAADAAYMESTCTRQINIIGAMLGKRVYLHRVASFDAANRGTLGRAGTVNQAVPSETSSQTKAAEIFKFSLDVYLSHSALARDIRELGYQSITSMPPSF